MKWNCQWRIWLCRGVLVASIAVGAVRAEGAAKNPFAIIVERNVFQLRPFVYSTELVREPPPKVLPKIVVTGITDVCGRKQALVEISETGRPSTRPVLTEGESFAGVTVEVIDVDGGRVKLSVQGEVLELELQAAQPPPQRAPVLAVRR
jgi:hypothetical protein